MVISIFYVFIAFIGLWASFKSRTGQGQHGDMLANRDIGFLVGLFTMTATWVCGGYINGTAEEVYKDSKGNEKCFDFIFHFLTSFKMSKISLIICAKILKRFEIDKFIAEFLHEDLYLEPD